MGGGGTISLFGFKSTGNKRRGINHILVLLLFISPLDPQAKPHSRKTSLKNLSQIKRVPVEACLDRSRVYCCMKKLLVLLVVPYLIVRISNLCFDTHSNLYMFLETEVGVKSCDLLMIPII